MDQTHEHAPGPQAAPWGWGNYAFIGWLFLAAAAVLYCARFAYREALLEEAAKVNAMHFLHWAEASAQTGQRGEALTLSRCAREPLQGGRADPPQALEVVAGPSPEALRWQACRDALLGAAGPLSQRTHPSNAAYPLFGPKCQRGDAATRGQVILERWIPGGVTPASWVPLADADIMSPGLMLRVQVCDAGGYLIKIGEVTL